MDFVKVKGLFLELRSPRRDHRHLCPIIPLTAERRQAGKAAQCTAGVGSSRSAVVAFRLQGR
jgi:hypothetical protein